MPKDTLSVLFYNTALIPGIWPDPPRAKPVARAKSIGRAVWPNHDVIGLCEVWESGISKKIKEGYPSKSYQSYYDPDGSLKSGLFFTSKGRIKKKGMLHFKEHGSGEDAWARKGVMWIRIGSNYSDVDLFLTHLQAHGGKSKQQERLRQLAEVVEFMKKCSSPTTPTIVMGDMNINGMKDKKGNYSKDYKDMLSCLGQFASMVDANLYVGKPPHATTFDEKNFKYGTSRLDYLIASNPAQPLPKNPYVLDIKSFNVNAFPINPSTGYCTPFGGDPPKKCTLSDHAGVEAVFKWRKA